MAPEAEREIRPAPSTAAAPLTSQMLDVGDGHLVYVETSGNPEGIPAVYLHGGPGSGCQPDHRRLFDAQRFHAILFDQRGAGRSRPKGGREANTLQHLIADMEKIRITLGIERWLVVGGSWGATLGLAYAQAHPDRVCGIVLRATFLGTRAELEAAFLRTLPTYYPDLYADFLTRLPEHERATPLDAYWRRILDTDPVIHAPAARGWGETESILSQIAPKRTRLEPLTVGDTRPLPTTPYMEAHYFVNDCFMRPDQLMTDASKLAGIPGLIVQGRYDLLCPPATAHRLSAAWPDSEVRTIDAAGHLLYDPGIRDAVIAAINHIADRVDGSR